MSIYAQKNSGINLQGKTAAVAGGTTGIGAAIAQRFATAGSSVFVIGRNQDRGNKVIEELKRLGDSKAKYEFIQADLSSTDEVKRVAEELKKKSGGEIHYLVTTQGGPPNGDTSLTPESHNSHFTIQTLSRFGLACSLASSNTLKDSWISILSPGGSSSSPPDLQDIELKDKLTGMWALRRIVAQGTQDGALGDAMAAQFPREFPHLKAFHLFPGFVHTSAGASAGFPTPILWAQNLFGPILAKYAPYCNTPHSYSEIPFYVAVNPEGRKDDSLRFSGIRVKGVGIPKWAEQEGGIAKQTWETLKDIFEKGKASPQ
ncbi:putative short-chain dehydrogenase/reductase [Sporobolomyces salmoneus]|uniref:putative short-chain dehydrogenase/reductase n=1 Tax=Sporobolomyces salmoneus TaxID=183962 RepID=UPI00317199D2